MQDGPEPTYPLADTEQPEQWTQAVLQALDLLLAAGTLDHPDGFGGTTVQSMLKMARGPFSRGLQETVGRRRLLGELIRNLADPGRINQGHRGTCSVTCIESWAAERSPGEYARLLAALCGPAGGAGLRNGEALIRDADRLTWQPEEARRSPLSRLFQSAAMELAYADLDYDDARDLHLPAAEAPSAETASTGVGLDAFDRLLEGISGQTWSVLTDQSAAMARALGLADSTTLDLARDGMRLIQQTLQDGGAVFVTLGSPDPVAAAERARLHPLLRLPHKVRVLAIEADRVVYEDPLDPESPWVPDVPTRIDDADGRCSMSVDDFRKLMVELSYPPVSPPT